VTDDTYVYEKSYGADVLYVALNRADVPNTVTGLPSMSTDLISGSQVVGPAPMLPARSAMILQP